MRHRLISCEQVMEYGKPVACLYSRGEDGQRYITKKSDLSVYCYTEEYPTGLPLDIETCITKVEPKHKSIFGQELYKVFMKEPRNVSQLKKFMKCHEADIIWTQRALIDMEIKDGFTYDRRTKEIKPIDVQDIKLRTWVIDIEVTEAPTIPSWKDPYYPIVCIVVYDTFTEQYYKFSMKDDLEVEMLEKFAKLMQEQDPDIITGWNIDFDISYIIGRMEHLRKYFAGMLSPSKKAYVIEQRSARGPSFVKIKIAGRAIFDSLKAYKVYKDPSGKQSSYNLKSVAKNELGVEWIDYGAKITEAWKENPDKVIDYCALDVKYTWEIAKHNNLIELYLSICQISGVSIERSMSKEAITDSYLLRIAKSRVLPSRDTGRYSKEKDTADEKSELKGGLVLAPKTGLHEGIACFDAVGLYISIMIGFNISPECKDDNGQIRITDDRGNTYKFRSPKEKVGIVPEICMDFKRIRKESKQKKQDASQKYGPDSTEYKLSHQYDVAIKTVMNGVYGVVGNPAFRLFDLECANSITAVGRNVIHGLSEELGRHGFPVIYGDTDSVFVSTSTLENAMEAQKLIERYMDEKLREWGVGRDAIEVGFEKFFSRLLFKSRQVRKNEFVPVKKKYVGHMIYSEGEECDTLFIRGFETRRSDTSKILNKTMLKFFELVIQQNKLEEGLTLLRGVRDQFASIDPAEIAVPRAIHKEIEASRSPWVRGRKYAEENCGYLFDEDTSPRLLYIKRVKNGHPETDTFCIQEGMKVPEWIEIDYEVMFEKVMKKKFLPILHELGQEWDVVIENLQVLDEWF